MEIIVIIIINVSFIGVSLVAQMVKNLPVMKEIRFNPWVTEIPRKRKWQPALVFLPGEFRGQRSLAGYSP